MYYYTRNLSAGEQVYVNRAMQRIAQLAASTVEETDRNDVTYENEQCSVELQYSIDTLLYKGLDWTTEQIVSMMDYYTLRCRLHEFTPLAIDLYSLPLASTLCADNSILAQRISELTTHTNIELTRIEAESIARDNALGGGVLSSDLITTIAVGGISAGVTFDAGTTMEELWQELVGSQNSISNLSYNNYAAIIESDIDLSISQFTWTLHAAVTNLRLSDSEGVLVNVPVTGDNYTPSSPVVYSSDVNQTITWTLTGDNMNPVTLQTTSRYQSYFGKHTTSSDTPVAIVPQDLTDARTAGDKLLALTEVSITADINTGNSDHGWIAVPEVSNGTLYTNWWVAAFNHSEIATDDFILPVMIPKVSINMITYNVYRWAYRSPLTEPLKLF